VGINSEVPVGVTSDLAGDPRIVNLTVDMGAYEFVPVAAGVPMGGGTYCPGTAVALFVAASGQLPLSYQWRRNMVDVSDGGAVSGAHTAVLTINPATPGDSGSYDCEVTDAAFATATSSSAMLTIADATMPTVVAPMAAVVTQTTCQ
jgi:hypothetical protein